MRALPIDVYKNETYGDCSNSGISSRYSRVLLVCEDGPDHNKSFRVAVKINDKVIGDGEGRTKTAEEQEAAYYALIEYKKNNN